MAAGNSMTSEEVYYVSTRDPSAKRYTFEDGLRMGYAPDGGLFVPESFNRKISRDTIRHWLQNGVSFEDMAHQVLRCFISVKEIDDVCLQRICREAVEEYDDPSNPVPIVKMDYVPDGEADEGMHALYISQLFHGPTFCFKDLGQQFTIKFLDHFATKSNSEVMAICSTTGDTGPAALRAAAKSSRFRMLVAHPEGAVSNLQRKQMTTIVSPTVKTCVFQGGGDDLDAPIKNLMTGTGLKAELTGVNSYNIGRPVAQVLHYFWSYVNTLSGNFKTLGEEQCAAAKKDALEVDFIVPTGAMGNICAGVFAKAIGLPIQRFITSSNKNDVGFRAFTTGTFKRDPVMHKNLAEAMNIQVPYNFERILYVCARFDELLAETADHATVSAQIADCMRKLDATGEYEIPKSIYRNMENVLCAGATRTDDEEIQTVIRKYYRRYSGSQDALHCPHSACAVRGAEKWLKNNAGFTNGVGIVLATASWCKFGEVISDTLGPDVASKLELPKAAQELMKLPEKPYDLKLLRGEGTLESDQKVWESAIAATLDQW